MNPQSFKTQWLHDILTWKDAIDICCRYPEVRPSISNIHSDFSPIHNSSQISASQTFIITMQDSGFRYGGFNILQVIPPK